MFKSPWSGGGSLNIWLALLLFMLIVGLVYIFLMQSKTSVNPLPPLTSAEIRISDYLSDHVHVLAGRIGERNLWHYPALQASANYIDETFIGLGYKTTTEAFESRGRTVRNIMVEKPGASLPEEIILVGAHYDSVVGSPGANDNGSGVAALLELGRLLANQDLPRTLRLVAFVNEEHPFFGTPEMGSLVNARAARRRGDLIRAMLSLETIGYYSDQPDTQRYPFPLSLFYPNTANFIGIVGNLDSRRLVRSTAKLFRSHTSFPLESAAVPASIPGVGWSDHWSYWQAGYRAVMVTDTAFYRYAHYHTARDTPDKIDYRRMARVVAGLARVVADLAGKPSDID